jgi:hypothetical protein
MSLADYIPAKFIELFSDPNFSKALDRYFTSRIKEDRKFRDSIKEIILESYETQEFQASVETVLATSELKILKRINAAETVLGINETIDYDDDERELSLLERIDTIEDKLENLNLNAVETPTVKEDTEVIPTTKTEHRACGLFEELKKAKDRAGHKFLSSDEMNQYLMHGVGEEYRVKEGQNIRQIKKEVLAKMRDLFSGSILLNQKTTGWKNYRLVLKA